MHSHSPLIRAPAFLLRKLFPPGCAFCGDRPLSGRICVTCRFALPRSGPACPRCAEPLAASEAGAGEAAPDGCPTCRRHPPPYWHAHAAFSFAFPVDTALKALKFHGHLRYAPAFAELIAGDLSRQFPAADALAPVPLHPLRHVRRGFNQAVEIARPLGRRAGLPVLANLRRIRHTAPQTGLNAAARRRNLAGAFRVRGQLRARRPVIVDDVMTTGETCRQLAGALLAAGALEVGVLAVARAPPAASQRGRKL